MQQSDLEFICRRAGHFIRRIDAGGSKFIDLLPLVSCSQLVSLTIMYGEGIDSLEPLAGLTQLTHLRTLEIGASDLSPLSTLSQLAELDFSMSQMVAELQPLSCLHTLA